MLYKALAAVIVNGSRIEKDRTVECSPALAESIGSNLLIAVGTTPKEEAPAPVVETKALDDLSLAELKAEAAKLGIKATGTKADLIERIKLAAESTAEPIGDEPAEDVEDESGEVE